MYDVLRFTLYVPLFAPTSFIVLVQAMPPLGGPEMAMVNFSHAQH
jgi:hypothetical protein